MRKNIIFVLLLVIPVMSYACIYVDSTECMIPKVTSEFEKFDSSHFKKIEFRDWGEGYDTLQNGTFIVMRQDYMGKGYYEFRKNQYFSISKVYYANGNIKKKGLCFIYSGIFEKGVWYNFDEAGNLTDSIDYDEPYKFTFEQVLDFSRKEGIKFRKFDVEYKPSGFEKYNELHRYFHNYYKKHVWVVTRWNQERLQMESIFLDARTGEVIEREFMDYLPR